MSTPKQPLHPSVIPRLDPEYVEFHTKHILNLVAPHTLPWSPEIRNGPAVPGASAPLSVAKTQDYDLPNTKFRAFTPEGEPPAGGWPLFIFFHGGLLSQLNSCQNTSDKEFHVGGWTLGNIGSETAFCTNMSVRAYALLKFSISRT
jgi:hypothetical protein